MSTDAKACSGTTTTPSPLFALSLECTYPTIPSSHLVSSADLDFANDSVLLSGTFDENFPFPLASIDHDEDKQFSRNQAESCRFICPRDVELTAVDGDLGHGHRLRNQAAVNNWGDFHDASRCNESAVTTVTEQNVRQDGHTIHNTPHVSSLVEENLNEAEATQKPLDLRSRNIPIKEWFTSNIYSPYATEDQIQELANKTSLTCHQVRVCLNNLRARMKPHCDRNSMEDLTKSPPLDTEDDFSVADFDHTKMAVFPDLQIFNRPALPEPSDTQGYTIPKRKGKRRYTSRYQSNDLEGSMTVISDNLGDSSTPQSISYHCTMCPTSFGKPYEWRRHESAVHGFRTVEWICMLNGPMPDNLTCAFCSENFPSSDHIDQHDIIKCLDKGESDRTFFRKDLLKQHIRQAHLADMEPSARKAFKVPDCWAKDVDADRPDLRSLWCGFCQTTFASTATRMDHVVKHFRNGARMSSWQPIA